MTTDPISRTDPRPVPATTDQLRAGLDDAAVRTPTGSGVVSRFFPTDDVAQDGPTSAADAREAEGEHDAVTRSGAVRTVAAHAVDAEDCTELLAMLGLDAGDATRSDAVD